MAKKDGKKKADKSGKGGNGGSAPSASGADASTAASGDAGPGGVAAKGAVAGDSGDDRAKAKATTPKPPPPATTPPTASSGSSPASNVGVGHGLAEGLGDDPSRPPAMGHGNTSAGSRSGGEADTAAFTGAAPSVAGVVAARGEDTGSAARTSASTPAEVPALATPSRSIDVETTTPTSALTDPGGDAAEAARRAAPGSSAPLIVGTPTGVEAPMAPAGPGSPAIGARPGPQLTQTSNLVDGLAEVLRAPSLIADRVLPAGRTPMVLGVAALTLAGVLDWPAAIAVGLGYEAMRRWAPAHEHTRRS